MFKWVDSLYVKIDLYKENYDKHTTMIFNLDNELTLRKNQVKEATLAFEDTMYRLTALRLSLAGQANQALLSEYSKVFAENENYKKIIAEFNFIVEGE